VLVVAVVVAVTAGLAYIGTGVAALLLPEAKRGATLLLAPFVGISVLVLACAALAPSVGLDPRIAAGVSVAAGAIFTTWYLTRFGLWRRAIPPLVAVEFLVILITALVINCRGYVVQGLGNYFGTGGSDYLQSLALQEATSQLGVPFNASSADVAPILGSNMFLNGYPLDSVARFGIVSVSAVAEQFSGDARSALSGAVVIGICLAPIGFLFFIRACGIFGRWLAYLAIALYILSSAVAFQSTTLFVGQNSTVGFVPVFMALAFLAVRSRDARIALLLGGLLTALLFMYLPLVVILLPVTGLALAIITGWRVVLARRSGDEGIGSRRITEALRPWLRALGAFLLVPFTVLLVAHQAALAILVSSAKLFEAVSGRAAFYVDWLGPNALVYATGIAAPPAATSWVVERFGSGVIALAAVILLVAGSCTLFSEGLVMRRRGSRRSADSYAILIYAAFLLLLGHQVFVAQYGYGVIKIACWFAFVLPMMLVLALRLGWRHTNRLWRHRRGHRWGNRARTLAKISVTAITGLVVGAFLILNVLASWDYQAGALASAPTQGYKTLVFSPDGSAPIEAFSKQVAAYAHAHGSSGKPGPVTLAMDYGENMWFSYYLWKSGVNANVMSHEQLPLPTADGDIDFAGRPGLGAGSVSDSPVRPVYTGTIEQLQERSNFPVQPGWILAPSADNQNKSLVVTSGLGHPLMVSRLFHLQSTVDATSLFSGRGTGRVITVDRSVTPSGTLAWAEKGVEFIVWRGARGQQDVRFSGRFSLGPDAGTRTQQLNIFLNGRRIGSSLLQSEAWTDLSIPIRVKVGPNIVVLKLARGAKAPSRTGWWTAGVPTRDGALGLLVSNFSIASS
jgi:hypothetical protein